MKKGPLILLVLAMCLAGSVAAHSSVPRTGVLVVDDVGDTKVVKKTENFIRLEYAVPVAEITTEQIFIREIFHTTGISAMAKPVTGHVKKKIYLLNCSIRQC